MVICGINMKTIKDNMKDALESLLKSIDTFPDKDDKIRLENDIIYGMIATLKVILGEKYE
jgi:hypothetical protein